ncbi:related to cholinesterase [Cephalotrichum gorgonifer]|uniref:Carboxylic ester hydrolase n=1 Tax=Cephalotrichum gorgonifer TaxID=2041049 RepID=A0AAE8N4C3_9PEZI|nr:related to cholinesterase [Cephalotrichum gorgonifer]
MPFYIYIPFFKSSNNPRLTRAKELHRAREYDPTTHAYTFQDIRYAKPPTGDLRFRAPQSPEVDRSSIQVGHHPRTCPQGMPRWQALGGAVASKWADPSRQFDMDEWVADFYTTNITAKDYNEGPGGVSEDCLFLDVRVPKRMLKAASRGKKKLAPVLVWIHGGGYDLGSKQRFPSPQFIPTGLLSKGNKGPEGMIYVAMNYRLGAFGWLSGLEVERDGDLNAGLLDQRLALEWIQQYIHLFGGDKNRVTVMGESAGAGSTLLHTMAYGGDTSRSPTPFSQIIPQSPFIEPTSVPVESTLEKFLSMLNVSSLQEARQIDEKTLVAVNAELIRTAPANTYLFGPVIDKKYIPERPMKMLREGRFNKSVEILTTHTSFERGYFFDPSVEMEEEFREWINLTIPGLTEETIEYLAEELYLPEFDGSWGYTSQATRQMSLWGEAFFDCNFVEIGDASDGQAYAGEFGLSPGFHTQDLAYTFDFPGAPVPFAQTKDFWQNAIVSFTRTGKPEIGDGSEFPKWGSQGLLVNMTETKSYVAVNRVNKTRCDWWAQVDL